MSLETPAPTGPQQERRKRHLCCAHFCTGPRLQGGCDGNELRPKAAIGDQDCPNHRSGYTGWDTVNEQPLARPWWLLPPGRLHPLWWLAVAALLLGVDYVTGLYSLLPAVYVIPVTLAAWYSGRRPALALAVAVPLVHLMFVVTLGTHGPLPTLVATTMVRGAVIVLMALWFARLSEHERELHRHVHTLEGLLPICSFCKKIRNKAGEWERLETFISKRSDAQFSHGFCPACGRTHYADLVDDDVAPNFTVN